MASEITTAFRLVAAGNCPRGELESTNSYALPKHGSNAARVTTTNCAKAPSVRACKNLHVDQIGALPPMLSSLKEERVKEQALVVH